MRTLALAAVAAAALAVPVSPAAADIFCRTTVVASPTGNSVAHCTERRREYVDHYVRVCTDKNLDGQAEACKYVFVVSIFS